MSCNVNISLNIDEGNLSYRSAPVTQSPTLTAVRGPAPGLLTAETTGTDIDLSALSTPGLCWVQNLDDENYVTIGVKPGSTFYPVIELGPGEFWLFRLSRSVANLHALADTAACYIRVEAFNA